MSLLHRPLLGILAFFGIGSIIGSGFCLWVFAEDGSIPSVTIDGIQIDYSTEAKLGHFAMELSTMKMPTMMVFTEGDSSTDLNEGIEFYTYKENEITGKLDYVKDDEIEIVFHRNLSFTDEMAAEAGLTFQLGVTINLITNDGGDETVVPLTKYVSISNDLFKDGNFVNLTKNFSKGDTTFKHEEGQKDANGNIISTTDEYVEYTYLLHVDSLFAYASYDVKPNTLEKYKNLYFDFQNYSSKRKIEAKFTARYAEN